jgi:hypothetical protein
VFAATANVTVPLPVPEAPPVIVSHPAFALAVHAHVFAEGVTANEPEAPVSGAFNAVGEIVSVQGGGGGGGAPACETVKVCPPIVRVPLRAAPVFAAAVKATLPLPVLDAPAVTVNQSAFARAVHAHVFADAVTAIEPDAPVSATS